MSHITVVKTQIRDLAALEEALKTAFPGARLVRNAASFYSYQGDRPCDHKIKVDGVRYEIGIARAAAVTEDAAALQHLRPQRGYNLHHDFYGSGGEHDGNRLREKFGDGCSRLLQEYSASVAIRALRAKGCIGIKRTTKRDGSIVVRATLA